MAVNRFYRREPYDIGLYVPPVDVIKEGLQMSQRRYETNYALAEQIRNNYIPSLPQDRAKANEIQNGWEKKIDDIVGQYSGDYSRATKGLLGLLSEVRKEYNPGGTANAIMSNYNDYTTWVTGTKERVKNGKVLGEDMNLANKYFMTSYQGVGEVDPVTGTYNKIQLEELSDYQNPNEIIAKIYDKIKPERQKVSWTTFENNLQTQHTKEFEGVTADRLYPAFEAALGADPKYSTYMQQKARFIGAPQEFLPLYNTTLAQQQAKELAYMSKVDDTKSERDPAYLVRLKASLDKENNAELLGSFLQYGTVAPNVASLQSKIDPSDWKNSKNTSFWDNVHFGAGMAGVQPTPLGTDLTPHYPGMVTSADTTLDSFLKDPNNDKKLTSNNVIPQAARVMWEGFKQRMQEGDPAFSRKYGADKKYTAEVEKSFWSLYNTDQSNHSASQTYSLNVPSVKAKEANLQMLLPQVLSGGAEIYMNGKPGTMNSNQLPNNILSTFYDRDKKQLKDLGSLGLSYKTVGPDVLAAGYEVTTPKGTFTIVDQNYERKNASNVINGALAPIFREGKTRGNTGVVFDGKQWVSAVPEVEYTFNPGANGGLGGVQSNLYWNVLNSSGTGYESRIKKDLPQYISESFVNFNDALQYGASKADLTPFTYFMNMNKN